MSAVPSMDFLIRMAKALAVQFGPNCEVVVHDLTAADRGSTVVAIENGHVTGRKPGDGPSHIVLEALKGDAAALEDHLGYLTRTSDGRILKSSTVFLRDDAGQPVGILGINYDITLTLAMENALRQFNVTEITQQEPEPIARNVSDLLDQLIDQSVKLVGRPVTLMTKEDKVKAIRFLDRTGAFLITKSGDRVCRVFGISKYTLYSYLDSAREQGADG